MLIIAFNQTLNKYVQNYPFYKFLMPFTVNVIEFIELIVHISLALKNFKHLIAAISVSALKTQ